MAHGFNLDESAAADLLLVHYNPRAIPQWPEADVYRIVKEAKGKAHDKPAGHLLNGRQTSKTPATWREKSERYATKLKNNPPRRDQLAAMLGLPVEVLARIDLLGTDCWEKPASSGCGPNAPGMENS